MKITTHNYEAFFLDFVEGRLDNSSTLELLVFLNEHPHLRDELESFREIKVMPSEMLFQEKESLKKFNFSTDINSGNFDDYCIAYHERILSGSESAGLLEYLKHNPEKKRDFELYGKTYLIADQDIIFEGRTFLKKKISVAFGKIVLRWSAVAAGIILAVSIFYKSPETRNADQPKTKLAVNNQTIRKLPDSAMNIPVNIPPVKKAIKVAKRSEDIQKTVESKDFPVQDEIEYIKPISVASVADDHANTETEPVLNIRNEEVFPKIAVNYRNKPDDEGNRRKKITLWDVAQLGLKGYNQLSEKDIFLHRETDENGKLTVLAIETENGRYGFETKN